MHAPVRIAAAHIFRLLQPSLSGASVICYHSIGGNAARSTISPQVFEEQIAYITSRYRVLTPSQLVASFASGESLAGCVTITFDDGYADNLTTALPIMEKHKIRAGVFVITSLIGKTYTYSGGIEIPLMNIAQLREAHGRGLEILSHTATHRDVRDVPDAELEAEFEGSRRDLEALLGRPIPRIVAFPKGRSDQRVRAWLKEHGWHAFGTRGGIVTSSSSACDLERNGIHRAVTRSEFMLMFSDGVSVVERLRTLR